MKLVLYEEGADDRKFRTSYEYPLLVISKCGRSLLALVLRNRFRTGSSEIRECTTSDRTTWSEANEPQ